MDKVKIALAVLKKHHFWVLNGLIVVICAVVWYLATGSLADQFDSRKSTLQSAFSKVSTIASEQNPPNESVIAAIKAKTDVQRTKVLVLWEKLYDEQTKRNQLPDALSDYFKHAFLSLEPEEDLLRPEREEYREFIEGQFPKLEAELDVLRPKEDPDAPSAPGNRNRPPNRRPPSAGNRGPNLGMPNALGLPEGLGGAAARSRPSTPAANTQTTRNEAEMIGIVAWNKDDRNGVWQRFSWERTPNTQQVLNAQEDLWVYEALVRIIRHTNEGATAHYNATVKEIHALEIGAEAVASWQRGAGSVVGVGKSAKASGKSKDEGARYVDDEG